MLPAPPRYTMLDANYERGCSGNAYACRVITLGLVLITFSDDTTVAVTVENINFESKETLGQHIHGAVRTDVASA